MQFRVPQFIDIEDKLFGPFTFKQFVYMVGGGGLAFIVWKILPHFIAILFVIPIIGLALALTFYRVNNKPFIFTLEAFIKYQIAAKLYTWKQQERKMTEVGPIATAEAPVLPTLSGSKLKELSWSLDVLDNKEQAEQASDIDKIVEKSVKSKYDLKI